MRDDQTVAIAQHLWKIGRKPKMKMCPSQKSYPRVAVMQSEQNWSGKKGQLGGG
jgi:hypothetical protein